MARKLLNKKEEITLQTLVPEYYEDNTLATTLKKKADELNKQIKKLFVEDASTLVKSEKAKKDERSITVDGIVATYYVQERKTVNEEGLVEFLKEKGYTKAIKTVEVLDEDALEKMMYDGAIDKKDVAEMAKFTVVKDVPTLTVKLKKEG